MRPPPVSSYVSPIQVSFTGSLLFGSELPSADLIKMSTISYSVMHALSDLFIHPLLCGLIQTCMLSDIWRIRHCSPPGSARCIPAIISFRGLPSCVHFRQNASRVASVDNG